MNESVKEASTTKIVTLSRFWLLIGWGSLNEYAKNEKFVTKHFFQILLNKFLKMIPSDLKAHKNKRK